MAVYLLDTNTLSELRKRERANLSLLAWYDATPAEDLFVSVLALGELRRGIELRRRRDPATATNLERWLDGIIQQFASHIFPVTVEIADLWGRLCLTQPLPLVDGLMAATALVHDLTLVTRNMRDFERSGARLLNPFKPT